MRFVLPDRFWAKVNKTEGCWLWTAKKTNGYGRVVFGGKWWYAHRLSHEALIGPIPEGYEVDHLCKTPACVNPAHLEAVTPRVNTLRSSGKGAIHAAVTHCPKGHAYDDANTYRRNGRRACRACTLERVKAYKARRLAEMTEEQKAAHSARHRAYQKRYLAKQQHQGTN